MSTTEGSPRAISFQPDIYDRVIALLPESRQGTLLDVGAGEGFLSRKLRDLGYSISACDFSREAFKCPDVPFREADLSQRIPYPDDCFDCVMSVEVIEHLENHFQFVRELVRVTRPGGTIIVTTPNVVSLPSRWHFLLYGYSDCAPYPLDPTREDYYMQHINPIALPDLLFAFDRAQAEVTDVTTNRIRRGAWLPMALLYPVLALALRLKFLRRKHAAQQALHRRHIRWMLRPAALMGRIVIVVAQKP